jgi:DNA (cytosine-5)-methyltransferase 1
MKKWRVLNLYAGIGGNRKLWEDVDVTAVENDYHIAQVYKKFFPDDTVLVENAHAYLLKNFNNYDFIWSSPPCVTHAQVRYKLGYLRGKANPIYPDMKLYQEIIFLKYYFRGKWVVENAESYYEPMIKPLYIGRHYIWSNFHITHLNIDEHTRWGTNEERQIDKGFDLSDYSFPDKRTLLRNCVNPEIGKHVFDCARKNIQSKIVCMQD